jgi:hypothetical protein
MDLDFLLADLERVDSQRYIPTVRTTPLFAMPFISKSHHFTKTGSGQT